MSSQVFKWSWNILGQVWEAPFVWKLSNLKWTVGYVVVKFGGWAVGCVMGSTVKIALALGPDPPSLNLNRLEWLGMDQEWTRTGSGPELDKIKTSFFHSLKEAKILIDLVSLFLLNWWKSASITKFCLEIEKSKTMNFKWDSFRCYLNFECRYISLNQQASMINDWLEFIEAEM